MPEKTSGPDSLSEKTQGSLAGVPEVERCTPGKDAITIGRNGEPTDFKKTPQDFMSRKQFQTPPLSQQYVL